MCKQQIVRVLSLDWDWFFSYGQGGELERLLPNPLYEECSPECLTEIWASRYLHKTAGKTALDLSLSKEKLTGICSLLKKFSHGAEAYAAESHLSLYTFLRCRYPDAAFDIVQCDHHHDLWPIRDGKPDSGSWGTALMEEGRIKSFLWVGNSSSASDSGGTPVLCRYPGKVRFTTDPGKIQGPFDLVFLCRSLIWAPPHADREFRRLLRQITECASIMHRPDREESALWAPSFFRAVKLAARRQAYEAILSGYCPEESEQQDGLCTGFLPVGLQAIFHQKDFDAFDRFSSACRDIVAAEQNRLINEKGYGRSAAYREAVNLLAAREEQRPVSSEKQKNEDSFRGI